MMTESNNELLAVWWELALAWRLYDRAIRERRLEDAMAIARQRELVEARARELLNFKPRRT